jgi:hypothetical protein
MFVGSAIAWGASHYAEHRSPRMHGFIAVGMAMMFAAFFL